MNPRWILGGFLFVLVSGGAGYYIGTRQAMAKASSEIQALQARAAAAERSENEFKDEAQRAGEAGRLWAEQALGAGKRIEELRAKLAKLQGKPDSSGPGVVVGPDATPLPCDSSVLAAQAQLIDAQDVKIKALEGQVGAQQTQIAGLEKALKQADLKADILNLALKVKNCGDRWSASGGYGTNRTISVGIEREITGSLSAGVDIIRMELPSGIHTIEAVGHLRWSF